MIAKFGFCLGMVCVMILIRSCSADDEDMPPLTAVKNLHDLLSDFKADKRPTWEMLLDAESELKALKNQDHILRFQSFPQYDFLNHSVLLPFTKTRGTNQVRDEQEVLIDTLIESYRRFWPYYIERKAVSGELHETPNCDVFYSIVSGKVTSLVLTPKLIEDMKNELDLMNTTITGLVALGHMPFKKYTLSVRMNALIRNRLFVDSIEEARQNGDEGADQIVAIIKNKIDVSRKRKREEKEAQQVKEEEADEEWEDEIEKQLKRLEKGNPNPSDEAGPSGQS